jgi:hypothetical protein
MPRHPGKILSLAEPAILAGRSSLLNAAEDVSLRR